MLFHEKLRKLRREKNWSQAELSEHLGIHTSHIYRLETGKSAPSMELIQTIARVFDVTTDYLLKDAKDTDRETKKTDEILSKYETLTENHKNIINELIDALFVKDQIKKFV